MSARGYTERAIVAIDARRQRARRDNVLVEAPLEIRWAGDALATTMRTPGQDHDLALGFLRAEGVIQSAAEVGTVAHCGRPGEAGFGNVIDVSPGPGVALDPERRLRRGSLVSSSCGVCGRQSIADLLAREQAITDDARVELRVLLQCVAELPHHQPLFEKTGGVHGAALFDEHGTLLGCAEDIGRHNAVDKLIGRALRGELGPGRLLVVSGRLSFEIIHKAAVLRVPIVASVSAASSLAIDLADAFQICAVGFARQGRANIYTHAHRIESQWVPGEV